MTIVGKKKSIEEKLYVGRAVKKTGYHHFHLLERNSRKEDEKHHSNPPKALFPSSQLKIITKSSRNWQSAPNSSRLQVVQAFLRTLDIF